MNVLAIGAHFDDIELGCGGSLAKHVHDGDTVYAYVATKSGYMSADNRIIRTDATAQNEGRNAMRALGVNLIEGPFETLKVEFSEDLNVDILSIVEAKKIRKVYTHWSGDIHHDHQAVSKASLHSCRHVPCMLMYRSNWYHSPHDFHNNFYIDISNHWSSKESAIREHVSELERTHHRWIEFFKNEALNAGQKIGVKYAEVFEVVKWLEA